MPLLSKQVIANYFRSECKRRLRLELSPDRQAYQRERQALGMPRHIISRPGLQNLAEAGEEWERAKINDLIQAFGISALLGTRQQVQPSRYQFLEAQLSGLINQASTGNFLVQATYQITNTFENTLAISHYRSIYSLGYSELRPDLIQILSPGSCDKSVQPDGSIIHITEGDRRLPLRVIDIKLTAEASVPYQVEVTYYSMVLAGWLIDNNLGDRFFVSSQAAIWPGSHDISALVRVQRERQSQGLRATITELLQAFTEDLEPVVFSAIATRLRRFLQYELTEVLNTPWRQLEWHVDNRCSGCDYLGYPWPGATVDPDHCWPMAISQDHLSKIAFMTRGARGTLESSQFSTVSSLANLQVTNQVYDEHHILRATRTVIASRVQSLITRQTIISPQSGTSAVMPARTDLHIYLTADFDIGSGITIAFGFKAFWGVSSSQVEPSQQSFRAWQTQIFPVDQKDLIIEQRELLDFLDSIHQALQAARQAYQHSTFQVYIWDSITYDHLVRVIGRHLQAILQNQALSKLAWLFPPESIVANPDLSDRRCPITIIRDVIRAIVAVPVPHYYSLLNTARAYYSSRTQQPYNLFQVPFLFEDALSDQVPSERTHEIWSRATGSRHWNVQLQNLNNTIRTKLSALESITQRLESDLSGRLSFIAPKIEELKPPQLPQSMADDSRLWFVFARLNEALEELEVQKTWAMPTHEREARFKSALLTRRLSGQTAQQILASFNLQPAPNRFVYELNVHSREVRAKEGDFNFALSPMNRSEFLEEKLRNIAGSINIPIPQGKSEWLPMQYITQVSVTAIDRDQGYIVLDLNNSWLPVISALETNNRVNLSQDVMLDPVHRDSFINRLKNALKAIGNPSIASSQPTVTQAIGRPRRSQQSPATPVADIYWNASHLYQATVLRVLTPVRTLLEANGFNLNSSQWLAWEQALSHRLHLIWGPPGTGKSKTLKTIVLGAFHEAVQQNRGLRILITGPTYEAIDNVLLDVYQVITNAGALTLPQVFTARLRSTARPVDTRIPRNIDVPTDSSNNTYNQLLSRLQNGQGLTLVGATVHQTFKLLSANNQSLQQFFDLILVDEASQVDVAASTLALAGLAPSGSVIIAGDPKQLPPIHKAESPIGIEHMVGPIYSYLETRFNLTPSILETNYRSCSTFTEFAYLANYPRSLQAHSPDLQIDLIPPLLPVNSAQPSNWPSTLYWTPEWESFLDPLLKAVCFVYPEGRSSQWNPFEADAIVSLVWLLANRLGNQLLYERDPVGNFLPTTSQTYTMADFWDKGIGIVTPHRAQQALVVSKLQSLFPGNAGQGIREAVDTVERFQGQQRDIILATFALGDADSIEQEDEFLLSLNRFNVMASRTRAKLIVFVSQEVVNHLSSDIVVLRNSTLLKDFVENFCNLNRPMTLGHTERDNTQRATHGLFRYKA